jgi:hypothetical protein
MPDVGIRFTNIECGDSITSPFTLQIQYASLNAASVSITAAGAAIAPNPIAVSPVGTYTPVSPSPVLTYSPLPVSEAEITATLLNSSGGVICSDSVSDITVTEGDDAAIQITSPRLIAAQKGKKASVLRIKEGNPITGIFDASLGTNITLVVETRQETGIHKREVFLDAAKVFLPTTPQPWTFPSNPGIWEYPWGLDPADYKEGTLMVLLTRNGVVTASIRAKIA